MATPTVLAISNAVGNGTTTTYTFSLTSGPAPTLGLPIIVKGCTTAGFNGNFSINGGNLTTTITVANGTNHASEAETATGRIDIEGFALIPSAQAADPEGPGEDLFEAGEWLEITPPPGYSMVDKFQLAFFAAMGNTPITYGSLINRGIN